MTYPSEAQILPRAGSSIQAELLQQLSDFGCPYFLSFDWVLDSIEQGRGDRLWW